MFTNHKVRRAADSAFSPPLNQRRAYKYKADVRHGPRSGAAIAYENDSRLAGLSVVELRRG